MPENAKIDFYNREKQFNRDLAKINSWCKSKANRDLIHLYLNNFWCYSLIKKV